jgi:hypothetical protein
MLVGYEHTLTVEAGRGKMRLSTSQTPFSACTRPCSMAVTNGACPSTDVIARATLLACQRGAEPVFRRDRVHAPGDDVEVDADPG